MSAGKGISSAQWKKRYINLLLATAKKDNIIDFTTCQGSSQEQKKAAFQLCKELFRPVQDIDICNFLE